MSSGFLKQSELFVFIALLLAMALAWVQSQPSLDQSQDKLVEAQQKIIDMRRLITKLVADAARSERAKLAAESLANSRLPDQPPIVRLSEDDPSFRFAPLSAELPDAFVTALTKPNGIIEQLDSDSRRYSCDVIEVVGHTDEEHVDPNRGKPQDRQVIQQFDRLLIPAFESGRIGELQPASNVDLGMLRALSVVRALRNAQSVENNPQLLLVRYFLPYSAGQMIDLSYRIPNLDSGRRDDSRRRIEIRLLRSPGAK